MTSLLLNADQLADHVRSVGVSSLFADARMHGVLGLLGYTARPHLHPEIDDLRRRLQQNFLRLMRQNKHLKQLCFSHLLFLNTLMNLYCFERCCLQSLLLLLAHPCFQ